jgi:hypothetical protein
MGSYLAEIYRPVTRRVQVWIIEGETGPERWSFEAAIGAYLAKPMDNWKCFQESLPLENIVEVSIIRNDRNWKSRPKMLHSILFRACPDSASIASQQGLFVWFQR